MKGTSACEHVSCVSVEWCGQSATEMPCLLSLHPLSYHHTLPLFINTKVLLKTSYWINGHLTSWCIFLSISLIIIFIVLRWFCLLFGNSGVYLWKELMRLCLFLSFAICLYISLHLFCAVVSNVQKVKMHIVVTCTRRYIILCIHRGYFYFTEWKKCAE